MSQRYYASSPAAIVGLVGLLCCGPMSCGEQAGQPDNKPSSEPSSKPSSKKQEPAAQRKDKQGPGLPAAAPCVVFRRDRHMVVARVKGQDIKLEDIIRHIDAHSYKGYLLLAEGGHLDLTLSSPNVGLALLARQAADLRALELTAQERKIPTGDVAKERRQVAANGFLMHLENYKRDYRRRYGREYPENPDSIVKLNSRYLLNNGLALEMEAWLNTLVPDTLTQAEADWYLRTHGQAFNGYLDISLITIHNRDPKTGALYKGPARAKVTDKVLDIQRRLKKDGSNFAEVAARFSDAAKLRARAGFFGNVSRFDPKLPGVICRAAWGLRNGKFKGPIESPVGLHFVKRITYHTKNMVLRLDPKNEHVRRYVRQMRQEDVLFKARRAQNVELVY
ncbi:MAG: peptidylprolyl isomerase [Planctomycetota bacterium]